MFPNLIQPPGVPAEEEEPSIMNNNNDVRMYDGQDGDYADDDIDVDDDDDDDIDDDIAPILPTNHLRSGGGNIQHHYQPDPTVGDDLDRDKVAFQIWFCPQIDVTERALRDLKSIERERVWADLSANNRISTYQSDEPSTTYIDECLEQVQVELQHLVEQQQQRQGGRTIGTGKKSHHSISALQYVLQTTPQYLTENRELKLQFLRSSQGTAGAGAGGSQQQQQQPNQCFDPKMAALRIAEHFEIKRDLFALECLGRDIRFDDLSADDIECLRTGGIQFLAQPDHAGRKIFMTRVTSFKYKMIENVLRTIWYMSMAHARDEQVQKLGVVHVSYLLDGFPPGGMDYELARRAIQCTHSLPLRRVAVYAVFQETVWSPVVEFFTLVMTPWTRVRTRAIQGTYMECVYKLLCLGLSPNSIPVTENGIMLLASHQEWLEQQIKLEQIQKQEEQEQETTNLKRKEMTTTTTSSLMVVEM